MVSSDYPKTPLGRYHEYVASGDLLADSCQVLAVEKLQDLHHALQNYQPATRCRGWKAHFGLTRCYDLPRGLYLCGGVGRGKSMLMDLFYATAPVKNKRRIHFHAFMQEVHKHLHELRVTSKSGNDPILRLAKIFSQKTWLLCFDELQVLDVTDAVILGRLFEALFAQGIILVVTSNYPPQDLYKDGLQRELFLPFIRLVEQQLNMIELKNSIDYRLKYITRMRTYLTPCDQNSENTLMQEFQLLTRNEPGSPAYVKTHDRHIYVGLASGKVAFSTFKDLCCAQLGPGDYLTIARSYHTLFISGIPILSEKEHNEAKRFITLIDVLYEHKVKLLCTASSKPRDIYTQGHGIFEFQRTTSRLMEMQSHEYIEKAHRV